MVNVEEKLINYINNNTNYVCAAEISNPRVEDVTLETTGGTFDVFSTVSEMTIAVQCYGATRATALNVALDVQETLKDIANEIECVAFAEFGVPYNWTDREPRYQFTIELKVV